MAMNKQQKAQAAREAAAKTASNLQPVAATEQPKPEAPAAAVQPAPAAVAAQPTTPAQPSKQQTTIGTLIEAWTERKVDLSKMEIKDDGKFKLIIPAPGWPIIQIGASGGITLPQIRSYQSAFDAAVDGLSVF